MVVPNDTRGWIMTVISGLACVLGASVICADVIVCRFPGMKGFRIQNSDSFLSASLSLSFGVMLFSSTYKMLPSAKRSLEEGHLSHKAAAWVLIGFFIAGAVGIHIVSRILHHYMPSHVVSCEHSHEEHEEDNKEHHHSRANSHGSKSVTRSRKQSHGQHSLSTPDLEAQSSTGLSRSAGSFRNDDLPEAPKPSLQRRLTRTLSKLSLAPKEDCVPDADGPCHGFTETCGQECFKIVQARGSMNGLTGRSINSLRRPGLHTEMRHTETTPLLDHIRETGMSDDELATLPRRAERALSESSPTTDRHPSFAESGKPSTLSRHDSRSAVDDGDEHPAQHHHHVPNNAFLSIGLQTSIAIALHKLPEGFITFATNHANPQLGFSVFLALFIHNITEGFALALPLYLAIKSRWKAMAWAFLLGGCSQPLGAGIAALWFSIAGNTDMAPGERVYGAMFALTSGIMTSVALQLFSESLDLTHNRNLCMLFAFVGMGIMGISSALTA